MTSSVPSVVILFIDSIATHDNAKDTSYHFDINRNLSWMAFYLINVADPIDCDNLFIGIKLDNILKDKIG